MTRKYSAFVQGSPVVRVRMHEENKPTKPTRGLSGNARQRRKQLRDRRSA